MHPFPLEFFFHSKLWQFKVLSHINWYSAATHRRCMNMNNIYGEHLLRRPTQTCRMNHSVPSHTYDIRVPSLSICERAPKIKYYWKCLNLRRWQSACCSRAREGQMSRTIDIVIRDNFVFKHSAAKCYTWDYRNRWVSLSLCLCVSIS